MMGTSLTHCYSSLRGVLMIISFQYLVVMSLHRLALIKFVIPVKSFKSLKALSIRLSFDNFSINRIRHEKFGIIFKKIRSSS